MRKWNLFLQYLPFLLILINLSLNMLSHATDSITISGTPGHLNINSANAGQAPYTVSDSSTVYSLVVDGTRKITGHLDNNLPSHTTLMVNLAAPSGASSLGAISLSTLANDLVTDIPTGSYSNLSINYQFSATPLAGVLPITSRTVTFTILSP